jgi:predicted nucleic acid-binding protein
MSEPFAGIPLVIDSSAWLRQREPQVLTRWEATARARLFVSCPVVALELLAAARDEAEHTRLAAVFDALPQAPVTVSACRAALTASRDLGGSRRLPAADYLIAAAAAERGFGVLHEDRHFETLARVLAFQSVRLIG